MYGKEYLETKEADEALAYLAEIDRVTAGRPGQSKIRAAAEAAVTEGLSTEGALSVTLARQSDAQQRLREAAASREFLETLRQAPQFSNTQTAVGPWPWFLGRA